MNFTIVSILVARVVNGKTAAQHMEQYIHLRQAVFDNADVTLEETRATWYLRGGDS